jgi:predicted cupin superfamily sugar epimerase
MQSAAYWIEKLHLHPHPEGGYFREFYKSELLLKKDCLTDSFHGDRAACTSIYFLLDKGNSSAFHKIASDEIWHFYAGQPLVIYELNEDGLLISHLLGNNPDAGEKFQVVITAGNWFASRLVNGDGYALVGCTVAPGFDFADFEMANRGELLDKYPHHQDLIISLTR